MRVIDLSIGVESEGQFANCAEARAAGAAPVREGEPGFGAHLDRDGDGIGATGGDSHWAGQRGGYAAPMFVLPARWRSAR
ncbi:excalibur calcium-binding domain-containing protein [Streptomyces sp. NBC_01717]|uniref:excalibur calcium-binding domain-containing protein n=1 Tax=Streptomyces sp. NBC_01717 TaxID=2975918 RepID=UPI003FCE8962